MVGGPTSSYPLDAETADRCNKNYEGCELKVVPTNGSRFIKLRAHYDFIDIKTDHNSDIGSFEVTLVALKDGLPYEVPVLNLSVLS